MEIILRQAVENLGKTGRRREREIRATPATISCPHGLAYEATPGNLKRIQQERDRLEAAENERRGAAQGLAEKLEQVSLTFSARVGEEGKLFGSVTATDIAQQLEAQGFHIEKRQIDLHEPIKALGVYRVPIRLHADVKPEVRVWVIKR